MAKLIWFVTAVGTLTLVTGIRVGWLDPMSNAYLGLLVGTALLVGFSVGLAAAMITAGLPVPTWAAFAVAVILGAAGVYGILHAARVFLPPVHFVSDIATWEALPAWRVVAIMSAPAAVVVFVPGFGIWRWWMR